MNMYSKKDKDGKMGRRGVYAQERLLPKRHDLADHFKCSRQFLRSGSNGQLVQTCPPSHAVKTEQVAVLTLLSLFSKPILPFLRDFLRDPILSFFKAFFKGLF